LSLWLQPGKAPNVEARRADKIRAVFNFNVMSGVYLSIWCLWKGCSPFNRSESQLV
jgi:hypothetical protein